MNSKIIMWIQYVYFLLLLSFSLFYRTVLPDSRKVSVCLSIYLSDSLSVRPPVKRVICDKTEERSVQIFYTIRKTN